MNTGKILMSGGRYNNYGNSAHTFSLNGTMKFEMSGGKVYDVSRNEAVLYMRAGTVDITISGTADIESIRSKVIRADNLGSITMTGGTVKSRGITFDCAYKNKNIDVTVSGGLVESLTDAAIAMGQGAADNKATCTVSGGTVKTPASGVIKLNGANSELEMTGGTVECTTASNVINTSSGTVTISGGTVKNNGGSRAIRLDAGATVTISGGTFIAGGYTVQRDLSDDASVNATLCTVTVTGGNFTGGFDVKGNTTLTVSGTEKIAAPGNYSAIAVSAGANATIGDVEITAEGNGNAVHAAGDGTALTLNGTKVTAARGAAVEASGTAVTINKGEYVSAGSRPTVTVDKNGSVEVNKAKVTNIGTGSAVSDINPGETGNGYTNSIVINGGTYTANGTVLRAWEKDAETGAQTATLVIKNANIYSFENDENGSYAFGGDTTVNGYMAAMLNPAGQFGGRDYETTTTVDGKTLYVFTDEENGGPMVAQSGASMRIAKGSDGLRFTSFLSQKTVDAINAIAAKDEDGNPIVTFGTAIVPTHIIAEAGLDTFDVEGIRAAGYRVLMIEADRTMANTLRDEEGEVYGYNIRAAITGIGVHGEERYNWKYSAITYITYTNARSGEVETVYGAYNEAENSRCITEIAVKAYADVKDVDDEGYDPSVYIYACEGGYSPYTTAQRATIKSFADKYDAALIK